MATNSARDWLRANGRRRSRFGEILPDDLAVADQGDATTEQRVTIALLELQDSIPGGDFRKLRMLAGLEPLPTAISERTLRHWRKYLAEKYGPLFAGN